MTGLASTVYQGELLGLSSGTLRIVIYVENYPQKANDVLGWLIITSSGGGGC